MCINHNILLFHYFSKSQFSIKFKIYVFLHFIVKYLIYINIICNINIMMNIINKYILSKFYNRQEKNIQTAPLSFYFLIP